jgi:hypothetical protein
MMTWFLQQKVAAASPTLLLSVAISTHTSHIVIYWITGLAICTAQLRFGRGFRWLEPESTAAIWSV